MWGFEKQVNNKIELNCVYLIMYPNNHYYSKCSKDMWNQTEETRSELSLIVSSNKVKYHTLVYVYFYSNIIYKDYNNN